MSTTKQRQHNDDAIQWKFLEPMTLTAWLPDGQSFRGVTRTLPTIACRLLSSDRHANSDLTTKIVAEGVWGTLTAYANAKATVGAVLKPNTKYFLSASVLPDVVHLSTRASLKEQPNVWLLYEAKHFRIFCIGHDDAFDVVTTVKNRFFRNENNPKFLGLNKEYRP